MTRSEDLTLFHMPNSRSTGVLILLEELGALYDLHLLTSQDGGTRQAAYLAINPMGKVPAVMHRQTLVTEQVALYIYLADVFPRAGLAPALNDSLRGPYLRWMAFYGACFEPALVDRAMKREPGPLAMSPYGDYATVMSTLAAQLSAGPYMLGETFSALDVLWGTALQWTTGFGLVAETPDIRAYVERICSRPAVIRAKEKDAALAAQAKPS